ncbi:MAG: response regulator transcription factor [Thermanaeromonas sp.]|uniref:response regulator n=1 Tax=Thermanaeromonas sp. TaxID=2003697 RepID=UPI00243D85D1|nr:response regulator transcription factor [Thermanaeromonas sp.]MCG0277208.1 response regulator transcription factor [Thermanaeromonas sp.]
MKEKITVLIADDHPLMREGIRKILSLEPRIVIVGEATDGRAVIELARELRPRIILMDINLPVLNGLEAAKVIRREVPQAEIIVLTIHEEEEYIMELFRAGVAGYLLKDISAEGLIEAVLQVAQGVPVIHPGVTRKMVRLLTEVSQAGRTTPETTLTRREREILACVVRGESNKDIAKRLFISEKTVKNHLTRIFRKIGVQDRTQAAIYALKHGLTDGTLE